MNIFGEKLADLEYKRRKGCYAVIIDSARQQVAVVLTARGHYFLPGGGMNEGEKPEECVRRELLEETGYEVEVSSFIGEAQRYFFSSKNEPLLSEGMFFLAELKEKVQEPIEEDHVLTWIGIGEIERLFHEHHCWAVRKAL